MPDPQPLGADIASDLMRQRVHSFTTEPLHSAAYLNDIVRYLSKKPPASARYCAQSPAPKENDFLYAYGTSASRPPHVVSYSQPSMFLKEKANQAVPDLLFFTGSPSSEWLEVLADHLNIDLRFVHSHLDFIPNAQRDWYTGSNLPSRNRQDFRLLIPSIVFVGTEGNSLSVDQLHAARKSCVSQLEKKAHAILSDGSRSHGQSIFRQVNVHRGDAVVIEQVISIAITGDGQNRKGKACIPTIVASSITTIQSSSGPMLALTRGTFPYQIRRILKAIHRRLNRKTYPIPSNTAQFSSRETSHKQLERILLLFRVMSPALLCNHWQYFHPDMGRPWTGELFATILC
jgi:hypothetical protein